MAKLLQGMTHLLQPLNLISNSDFSRGGGYPTTVTGHVDGGSGVSIQFCTDWALRVMGWNFNYTITRTIGKVTLDFTITGFSNVGVQALFMLCPIKLQFDSSKVYTVGAGIKWSESRKGSIYNINIYGFNNRNFYYESPRGLKNIPNWLSILSATNGSSYGGITFWSGWVSTNGPKDIIGNTIHVEVTNPFMYEGAFLNPPKEKSLDVQENSYLLCSDISNPVIYRLRNLNFGKGWLRVCHISTTGRSTETLTSINLIKTGGNARTARIAIKFLFFVANSSETYGYIGVDSYQASNMVRFTAARFAKSPEGDVFLEVYNNVSQVNNDIVYVTRVDCSCGYDSTNLLRMGESSLSMYKVNDATGDNDTLLGTQVNIGANTNLFTINF